MAVTGYICISNRFASAKLKCVGLLKSKETTLLVSKHILKLEIKVIFASKLITTKTRRKTHCSTSHAYFLWEKLIKGVLQCYLSYKLKDYNNLPCQIRSSSPQLKVPLKLQFFNLYYSHISFDHIACHTQANHLMHFSLRSLCLYA